MMVEKKNAKIIHTPIGPPYIFPETTFIIIVVAANFYMYCKFVGSNCYNGCYYLSYSTYTLGYSC
jgi:hypothetical protein